MVFLQVNPQWNIVSGEFDVNFLCCSVKISRFYFRGSLWHWEIIHSFLFRSVSDDNYTSIGLGYRYSFYSAWNVRHHDFKAFEILPHIVGGKRLFLLPIANV